MALTAKSKKPSHYKKRHAGHHRQGKHYLKAYFPYLPMLMVVVVGLAFNLAWDHGSVLGSSTNVSSDQLLSDTNDRRIDNQLPPLQADPQLTAAAQAKAEDMVQKNYWSHVSPSGQSPWSFIAAAGYQYQAAGENLAYGFKNADEVIAGWMNSPEHRANLLSHDYQAVGFGVAASPSFMGHGPEEVVVAEYAQPVAAAANISFQVANPAASSAPQVKGDQTELTAQHVARIQLLTGGHAVWSLVAASALMGAAIALFLLRHGFRVHRMLSRGEAFVYHHKWLDFLFVLMATAGYVLSRSGGFIR